MRWLGDIIDSIDISLNKLQEIMKDREASHVVPGKSDLHARGEGERVIFLQSW